MKKRYEYWLGSLSIKDNETGEIFDEVVDLLNNLYEENKKLKKEYDDLFNKHIELKQSYVDK